MWSFNVNLKTNSIQLNEEKLKKIEKKIEKKLKNEIFFINWKINWKNWKKLIFFRKIEKKLKKIEKNEKNWKNWIFLIEEKWKKIEIFFWKNRKK